MARKGLIGGLLVLVGLLPSGVLAQDTSKFADEAVDSALSKGVEYLLSKQKDDGSWDGFDNGDEKLKNPVGPSALIAYALLENGVEPQNARMAKALSWLAAQETDKVYTLGLRCNVWLVANIKTRGKGTYFKNLEKDTQQLVLSHKNGGYCYYALRDTKGKDSKTDNSNAQYGLLGVWTGLRGGMEIPKEYWEAVLKYWIRTQMPDGGWRYDQEGNEGRITGTMTAAGLASMYVCYNNLYQDKFVAIGIDPDVFPPYRCIRKGLDWFDKNFVPTINGGDMGYGDIYYYLYGVERVGLASGYKYFGKADWYKLGVLSLLKNQDDDGSFKNAGGSYRGPEISTAFALLFLVRGRNPVLFNKLDREGDWNNRPHDMANLTWWMSRTFETTVNWQIINLKVPVREWHDAPILYIAGCQKPKFTDEDIDKLRTFVWQGGMILSCTEGNGPFKDGMREVYKKMFPKYELAALPPEHDLYKGRDFYPLAGRPKFYMVSNGIRPLAMHVDEDLGKFWQLNKWATERWAFEAAENLRRFVTDKQALRYRGVSLWPEESKEATPRTIKLARLKHAGDYDPEPLGYERFSILMAKQAKVKLEVSGPMPIGDLAGSEAKIAAMTGTGAVKLTDEEKDALKKWVASGGTLIIDAAGGSKAFAESAEQLLVGMYGADALQILPTDSPIYALPGMVVNQVKYRRQAIADLGPKRQPNLLFVEVNKRPAVIYSAQDLTGGLVGCPAYMCSGYDPDSAFNLMRNIVLFAGGAVEAKPAAQPK